MVRHVREGEGRRERGVHVVRADRPGDGLVDDDEGVEEAAIEQVWHRGVDVGVGCPEDDEDAVGVVGKFEGGGECAEAVAEPVLKVDKEEAREVWP